MLLLNLRGPTCFDDLMKADVGNVLANDFVSAAVRRGLLHDDSVWMQTVRDAMDEKRSLSERIRWFAVFIANVLPKETEKLMEENLRHLAPWTGCREARVARLLRRIEFVLRAHGIRPTDGWLFGWNFVWFD